MVIKALCFKIKPIQRTARMDKYEEKITKQILELCNDENEIPNNMTQSKNNLFIWSVILLIITFVLNDNERLNQTAGFILLFLSGLLSGGAIFQGLSNKQWPILKKYLNKENMENSLSENKT